VLVVSDPRFVIGRSRAEGYRTIKPAHPTQTTTPIFSSLPILSYLARLASDILFIPCTHAHAQEVIGPPENLVLALPRIICYLEDAACGKEHQDEHRNFLLRP